jgi:hypothetical protein
MRLQNSAVAATAAATSTIPTISATGSLPPLGGAWAGKTRVGLRRPNCFSASLIPGILVVFQLNERDANPFAALKNRPIRAGVVRPIARLVTGKWVTKAIWPTYALDTSGPAP